MEATSADEQRRKLRKPVVDREELSSVLVEGWGRTAVPGSVRQLESYDDCNFFVLTDAGEALLVKYVNAVDSANHVLVEGYNTLLQHVGAVPGVVVPQPLQALSGADWVHRSCTVTDGSEQDVVVRALTWIEGETLSAYGSSAELLYSAGAYLGTLRQRLEGFNHPAFARAHSWDLKNFADIVHFVEAVQEEDIRAAVRELLEHFSTVVIADAPRLRYGIVQGDYNDANIIVDPKTRSIAGIIDFGDCVNTWVVSDCAIGAAYAVLGSYGQEQPIAALCSFVSGFCKAFPLTTLELQHMHTLVCCRLATSISIGAYSLARDPSNHYLLLHSQPAKSALRWLMACPRAHICEMLRLAAYASSESDALAVAERYSRLLPAPNAPTTVPITFVTGNAKKVEEVSAILSTSSLAWRHQKIDLPELQGEPEDVAAEKCRLAAEEIRAPVMVEDTSLCYNALGGLPGVYIKWFLEKTGHSGLNNLLAAYDDKTAYAQCVFAICAGPGAPVRTFVGRTHGRIVRAKGPINFGWDPIFQPDGFEDTYAEMSTEIKNAISHRNRALKAVQDFLERDLQTFLSEMTSAR